jgi:hypothetical protein
MGRVIQAGGDHTTDSRTEIVGMIIIGRDMLVISASAVHASEVKAS